MKFLTPKNALLRRRERRAKRAQRILPVAHPDPSARFGRFTVEDVRTVLRGMDEAVGVVPICGLLGAEQWLVTPLLREMRLRGLIRLCEDGRLYERTARGHALVDGATDTETP